MIDTTQISQFIEDQFPEIYREEGPFFVEFVKQYYVWMETDPTSPVYQARHYLSNQDIDTTVDDFIVYFKEMYLKNIQLNTATNTKQLVKNSIDLYRSKGTENSIKLFFDLIFSAPSEVYYPGEDVFKLSDSEWNIPQYIEVTSTPINRLLVGRQVKGMYSGATAFVERLVRRKVNNTYIEVLYISTINGNFSTGEIISLSSNSSEISLDDFPVMMGSLTSLDVIDGSTGFSKGDIVTLQSSTGSQGKALVQDLETITGIVSFNLVNGGWGYTSNSNMFVSEKVLQLANVQLLTSDNTSIYTGLTNVVQPLANVQWYNNTSSFGVGDIIYNYESDGSIRGISTILSAEYGNTTTSYFLLSTSYGNSAPYTEMPYTYYTKGNTASFDIYNAGWTDVSAKGIITGLSSNIYVTCIGSPTTFNVDEYVYQASSNNKVFCRSKVVSVTNVTSKSFTLKVSNVEGLFLTNFTLKGETKNGNLSIDSVGFDIGVREIEHNFTSLPGNYIHDTANASLSYGTVIQIPFGSGANVGYDTDLINTETVMINPNYVRDHIDETMQENWINSASYGASLNNASVDTLLSNSLRFDSTTIGTIARLDFANPGSEYSYPPFVQAIDPLIAPLHKMDFVIRISSPTGVFAINELVTQTSQGAKGLVKFANTTEVHVRRLTYEDRWQVGNTAPYKINGQTTGFSANIIEVTEDIEGIAGQNAIVSTKVTATNTAVATLKVVDSGFNYRDGETVNFISSDYQRTGTAITFVNTQGIGSGYHKSTSGFLSANKYLYDGDYYQDFSYEISSPITVDLYSDMLKNILHVSGTKVFASILKTNLIDATTKSTSSISG